MVCFLIMLAAPRKTKCQIAMYWRVEHLSSQRKYLELKTNAQDHLENKSSTSSGTHTSISNYNGQSCNSTYTFWIHTCVNQNQFTDLKTWARYSSNFRMVVPNFSICFVNLMKGWLTLSGWFTAKSIAIAAPRLGPTSTTGLLIYNFQNCNY